MPLAAPGRRPGKPFRRRTKQTIGPHARGRPKGALSHEEILAAQPDLEAADVEEALRYAAEAVRERELPIAAG